MNQVYFLKTSPKTVVRDYQVLMRAANYRKFLKKGRPVVIKLNLSWTRFYPGCSTWPWQLEGIVKTLLEDGFKPSQIIPVENRTVVTNVYQGAKNNKWLGVLKKYGIRMRYLTEEKYVKYKPKHKMLVLDKVFPRGIFLPKIIFGANLIHPPTLKMHVFTTTTGAIKNYFGMLNIERHFCHRFIHEVLADLLAIQKEIHPGIFAITDGVVAGEGSGPRAMKWHIKNLLLASGDEVALDSVSAKIMGFEPSNIKYLRISSEKGLGNIKPEIFLLEKNKKQITDNKKINFKRISTENLPNFHFKKADTFASKGQKLIYGGPKRLEKILLQTSLVPWSYLASNLYHDYYWYNFIGKKRVREFLKTDWGKLFLSF